MIDGEPNMADAIEAVAKFAQSCLDSRDDEIAKLKAQVKALTAERDDLREAVRVLGEECRVYRMHVGLCNAVDSRGRIVLSRLQRGTVASNLWDDAVRAVRNNHIARAAVEGGAS